jgi:hypothetical protein
MNNVLSSMIWVEKVYTALARRIQVTEKILPGQQYLGHAKIQD